MGNLLELEIEIQSLAQTFGEEKFKMLLILSFYKINIHQLSWWFFKYAHRASLPATSKDVPFFD